MTLTAVRPPARFGALEFDGDRIRHFKEKSTLHEGWINGGFFVVEPAALDYIESDVMWEHAPMEALAADGQLVAYRHEEFWQCMDTLRDLRYLESLWDAGPGAMEDVVERGMRNPLADDLDRVLAQTARSVGRAARRAGVLTGGTGFFGCWLLETLLWANERFGLGASVGGADEGRARLLGQGAAPGVASRGDAARGRRPHVRFPDRGAFSHVIHAATDTRRSGDASTIGCACSTRSSRAPAARSSSRARSAPRGSC